MQINRFTKLDSDLKGEQVFILLNRKKWNKKRLSMNEFPAKLWLIYVIVDNILVQKFEFLYFQDVPVMKRISKIRVIRIYYTLQSVSNKITLFINCVITGIILNRHYWMSWIDDNTVWKKLIKSKKSRKYNIPKKNKHSTNDNWLLVDKFALKCMRTYCLYTHSYWIKSVTCRSADRFTALSIYI